LGKLRIGHLSTFYHTAMVLMAREDTGRRLGSQVQWRLFGTGPAIVKAFEEGELDLAYIGLPPAIIGIGRGVGIVCISGGHMEGSVLSAKKRYRGSPEISDLGEILHQFAGLRIGVPGSGSIHDVILREYLERSGLKNEVEIVNFSWADRVLEALVKDDVAAAVGTPALAVAVRRYARGTILYPPSKLWPHNPSYGILAAKDFLAREREIAEKFLALHEEASSFLRGSPAGAARLISGYVGFIDEEFVSETLKVSPKYCAQVTPEYLSSTMEFVRVLKRLGYIKREIAAEEIFDLSLVNKIHPERDHYNEASASA
jgi:NitT/TauT family transport system substrate-binding protein